jgi:hypothetical protein
MFEVQFFLNGVQVWLPLYFSLITVKNFIHLKIKLYICRRLLFALELKQQLNANYFPFQNACIERSAA